MAVVGAPGTPVVPKATPALFAVVEEYVEVEGEYPPMEQDWVYTNAMDVGVVEVVVVKGEKRVQGVVVVVGVVGAWVVQMG